MHARSAGTFVWGASIVLVLAGAWPAPGRTTATKQAEVPAEPPRPAVKVQCAHIHLTGQILAAPPDFSLFGSRYHQMTLEDWLERLGRARQDEKVQAVGLEIESPVMNWSQAQELADAVGRLDKVKPVYTYLTSGGPAAYAVAAAGREVAMEPTGTLDITGLTAELMFFRGSLDWLGIEPQLIQIGRFKGAAEPLTQTGPSEEMLEVYNALLDDLYGQLCQQIARQRGLKVQQVVEAIDAGPLMAEEALKVRFVDRLVRKADWQRHVEEAVAAKDQQVAWHREYGRKDRQGLNLSNPFSLLGTLLGSGQAEEIRDPTVAIVHADGLIVPGDSGEGLFGQRLAGAKTLTAIFNKLAKDDRVKAVIFRINSPGGSALASELIHQAVQQCARSKPVIASISAVGASGGYYVAVGAPTILADPTAITGSIGVVGGKFAITALLEKLRISTHPLTRGKNAGLWLTRLWTEREKDVIGKHLRKIYTTFLQRVADSRGERIKDIDGVAEGRVFTGRQAVANGLIDQLGGLREAIKVAQVAANIERSHFITLPRPRTLMEMLSGEREVASGLTARAAAAADGLGQLLGGAEPLGAAAQRAGLAYLLNLAGLLSRETTLMALPCYLSIRW